MLVTIHQPGFLPWLGFFDKLWQSDLCVLLDHVQFEKNYFLNRNRVRSSISAGNTWLTVPVFTKGRFGQSIDEVTINNAANWKRKHLATLQQQYRSAPHFQPHFSSIQALYQEEWTLLVDLNIATILWLTDTLGITTPFIRSSQLRVEGNKSHMLLDICRKVDATEYLSGISGQEYLDQQIFKAAGVGIRFQKFHHPIYKQCHQPFVPALSTVDLILNHGSDSLGILTNSNSPRLSTLFS